MKMGIEEEKELPQFQEYSKLGETISIEKIERKEN